MELQHAAFAHFVELLRRRNVPGYIRREQERQQVFDARYCDTSTECPSTAHTDSDTDQFCRAHLQRIGQVIGKWQTPDGSAMGLNLQATDVQMLRVSERECPF